MSSSSGPDADVVTIGGGALFGMFGLVLAAPLTSAVVRIAGDLGAAREARESGGESPAVVGGPAVEPA